ncbi:MAG: tetratricopeptide repeat protein, partial [Xenococcaceae cyanobacterium MO_234.B1]|nr:tetratricopeptide repeat protein [Xenococcaceae cyanobacterium MO_234.B1]
MAELKQESIAEKIDYLHTQAVAKHKEGKLEEAIAFYLEVIELDENQPAWVYGNGITLLAEVGRFDEALELGEKAEKLHPDSDEVYRAMGIIYQKQNNLHQALNYFQKAIELNPLQPEWLYSQILEYTTSEAIKIQDELVNVEPESYPLKLDSNHQKTAKKAELKPESIAEKISDLRSQAVAKHKEGKVEEAIAFYLEVIELDENQPAWVYGNGITLLAEVGRFD